MRARWVSVLLAAALLAGCGSDASEDPGAGVGAGVVAGDDGPRHVHGMVAFGGDVYLATHTGLWRSAGGTTGAQRVGQSRQDVMGLALDGMRFLGSGHPDPQQQMPPHLGLIESRDGGRTWDNVSLLGEADFHALTATAETVYGFDGLSGRLLFSADGGRTWRGREVPGPVISLAVDPSSPSRVVASTDRGLWSSTDGARSWRRLPGRPPALLAWPDGGPQYAMDGSGALSFSTDAGAAWRSRQNAVSGPVAIAATDDAVFVATEDGAVLESRDRGRSWKPRIR